MAGTILDGILNALTLMVLSGEVEALHRVVKGVGLMKKQENLIIPIWNMVLQMALIGTIHRMIHTEKNIEDIG